MTDARYTIKPPVWSKHGFTDFVLHRFSVFESEGMWFTCRNGEFMERHATEAAARAWCEQRYYEWVRQFLEECE